MLSKIEPRSGWVLRTWGVWMPRRAQTKPESRKWSFGLLTRRLPRFACQGWSRVMRQLVSRRLSQSFAVFWLTPESAASEAMLRSWPVLPAARARKVRKRPSYANVQSKSKNA
jgi:hypothetical protein